MDSGYKQGILKDNFKGGLDNLDVDKLAGQLNDEVNKLNEKLNSGIVPQVLF